MACLKPLAADFNYYPRAMIRLCASAYSKPKRIAAEVDALGWRVAWGPVERLDGNGIIHSLAYIARRNDSDEYAVVLRGTTPFQMASWFANSDAVSSLHPIKRLAPHAPSEALISLGAFDAVLGLLEMVEPESGKSIAGFLGDIPPSAYIYVTGHGLGGTLVPPLFVCLNDLLHGGGFVANMVPFAFGGHTAGNVDFSIYFNSLFDQKFPWRIYNNLDIAPFCWHALPQLMDIYSPYGIEWHPDEGEIIETLFDSTSGKGYSHPQGSQILHGALDVSDDKTWFEQAIHQHHASTYQTLVDAAFPEQQSG